jgi:hypothetical protein
MCSNVIGSPKTNNNNNNNNNNSSFYYLCAESTGQLPTQHSVHVSNYIVEHYNIES